MASTFLKVNSPVPYIPIPGTWAWDEDPNGHQWWERGSAYTDYMATLNLVLHARTPFEWCTNLDGTLFERNHTIWKGAAKHLACHLERVPLEQRNLASHSHGGQVVFYACANEGVKINNLITVGTPVRKDMEAVIAKARPNIAYWHHIFDSEKDFMAVLGGLFDGRFGIRHDFPQANSRSDIKGIGHSKILNDPTAMQLWKAQGWANILAFGNKAFISL